MTRAPRKPKIQPSPALVDAVRSFVESIARDEGVTERVAVAMVSLAVARVAGEVAANSLMGELFGGGDD